MNKIPLQKYRLRGSKPSASEYADRGRRSPVSFDSFSALT